jgi:hypothetical protein
MGILANAPVENSAAPMDETKE